MTEAWTCMICGDLRPGEAILVRGRPFVLRGVIGIQNVRYCGDRERCTEESRDHKIIAGASFDISDVIATQVGSPEALGEIRSLGEQLEAFELAVLPDGRVVRIQIALGLRAILYWGPRGSGVYDDDSGFWYETPNDAIEALDRWRDEGFKGEPPGWFRHLATARRRPGGDPSKEYVHP